MVFADRMYFRNKSFSLTRKIRNTFFSDLIHWVTNLSVPDVCTGMRVFRRNILAQNVKDRIKYTFTQRLITGPDTCPGNSSGYLNLR